MCITCDYNVRMLEVVNITFQCTRDDKHAAPVTLQAGIPEHVARYLRTSDIVKIDLEWNVPKLSDGNIFQSTNTPQIYIPGEQFFQQNKIDLSKKSGGLIWRDKTQRR